MNDCDNLERGLRTNCYLVFVVHIVTTLSAVAIPVSWLDLLLIKAIADLLLFKKAWLWGGNGCPCSGACCTVPFGLFLLWYDFLFLHLFSTTLTWHACTTYITDY